MKRIVSKTLLSCMLVYASAAGAAELLLFGNANQDEFLGCLTCSHFDTGSICNTFGKHGSSFSNKSIWNGFSPYGSEFSNTSPWNTFASSPPVIVDRQGNFYGYLTANQSNPKRTRIKALVQLTDAVEWVTEDLERAQRALCGD